MNCHTEPAGRVLGFNTAQLNRTLHTGIMATNQLLALGAEYRPQNDVESDAHHRGHRREGSVLRPRRELVGRFPFNDRLEGGQPSSMKRWCHQLALCAMSIASQRKQRIRSHDTAEIGVGRVCGIGAGPEQLTNVVWIAEDDHAPEDG